MLAATVVAAVTDQTKKSHVTFSWLYFTDGYDCSREVKLFLNYKIYCRKHFQFY